MDLFLNSTALACVTVNLPIKAGKAGTNCGQFWAVQTCGKDCA